MKVVRLKLKEYMDRRGITQAKLAREANLAPNTVKVYYHGGVMRAELRVIAKLCEYLQCDLCDIMALEDE
jgi:DNA-binding Xre family transcriptional regulator